MVTCEFHNRPKLDWILWLWHSATMNNNSLCRGHVLGRSNLCFLVSLSKTIAHHQKKQLSLSLSLSFVGWFYNQLCSVRQKSFEELQPNLSNNQLPLFTSTRPRPRRKQLIQRLRLLTKLLHDHPSANWLHFLFCVNFIIYFFREACRYIAILSYIYWPPSAAFIFEMTLAILSLIKFYLNAICLHITLHWCTIEFDTILGFFSVLSPLMTSSLHTKFNKIIGLFGFINMSYARSLGMSSVIISSAIWTS